MRLIFETEDKSEEMRDILRCQRNLYSIPQGTFPLARDMGLPWELISEPVLEAENDFATAVIDQTQKYEPRVSVTACTFEEDPETGDLEATIEQKRAADNGYDT